jgi:hypothetical protein
MSTNFYLHRDPQNCGECGRPRQAGSIHIGKRSGGWVFTWQGFTAADSPSGNPLYGAESWRDFLTCEVAEGGSIKDEWYQDYTLETFFAEVESLRGQRRQSIEYPDSHKQQAGPDEVSYGEWF